jgi:hypothetical protein
MVYTLRVNLRTQGYPLKCYTYSNFTENIIQQFILSCNVDNRKYMTSQHFNMEKKFHMAVLHG